MNSRIAYCVLRIALVSFSAVLLALAFSSFNLEFLAWFAFVPLFFALEGKNKLQAFLIVYFCGFLFFALSMYWLIYVTPAGWIVLSLYQALYFGIFGLVFAYFSKPYSLQLTAYSYLTLPSAWVILEYVRSHLGGGIGWNLLGYSQYKNLPIIQIADITGVWGVSFLIMLMNVAVYNTVKMAITCYKKDTKFKIKDNIPFIQELKSHPAVQTFIVLVLFIATLAYGHSVIATQSEARGRQSHIKISVVQGNIPQRFKWDEEFKVHNMNRYEDLTIEAIKDNPQLVIWPETAVPGFLNYDKELMRRMRRLIKRVKIPILAGAPMISEEKMNKSYNSAVLFSDKGKILARYNKLHLVAFGEFIPFEKQLPFLRKLLPITGSFIPGEEFTIFKLNTVIANEAKQSHNGIASVASLPRNDVADFSVLICFEDIFPSLVREFVKRGADFMVNITNDAWFGKSSAAYQHAACSVFRAVENRRPFIRSANTGFSCFIDKTGKIYDNISKNGKDLFIQGVKTAFVEVDKDKKFSLYTKYGDLFVVGCIIILITCITNKIILTV